MYNREYDCSRLTDYSFRVATDKTRCASHPNESKKQKSNKSKIQNNYTLKFYCALLDKDSEYKKLSYEELFLYAFLIQKSLDDLHQNLKNEESEMVGTPVVLEHLKKDNYYIDMPYFSLNKLEALTNISKLTIIKSLETLRKNDYVIKVDGKDKIHCPSRFIVDSDNKEAKYVGIDEECVKIKTSCFLRILYAYIKGFTNGCNVQNESLAHFFGKTEKEIINAIHQLRKKGLLYRNLKTGYFEFGEKPLSRAKQVKLMSWDISAERVQSGCPF